MMSTGKSCYELAMRLTNKNSRLSLIIGIAGFLHDIGHGPFSHVIENYINDNNIKTFMQKWSHEQVGLLLVPQILKGIITDQEILLVQKIIIGQQDKDYPKFVFQIVNNKVFEVDLDRIDYLKRETKQFLKCGNDLRLIKSNINFRRFIREYMLNSFVDQYGNINFERKDLLKHFLVHRRLMYENLYYSGDSAIIQQMLYQKLNSFLLDQLTKIEKFAKLTDDQIID